MDNHVFEMLLQLTDNSSAYSITSKHVYKIIVVFPPALNASPWFAIIDRRGSCVAGFLCKSFHIDLWTQCLNLHERFFITVFVMQSCRRKGFMRFTRITLKSICWTAVNPFVVTV